MISKLRAAQHQLSTGTLRQGRSQTIETFLTYWLTEVVKPTAKPSTYRRYEQIVRNDLIPEIGRARVDNLTPARVQSLLNDRAARRLKNDRLTSPRTVHHVRSVLRAALNRAKDEGLVSRNVAEVAKPPKVADREMLVLNRSQAVAFLEAAKSDRLYALYAVALSLGLRQGEAFALRWEDVHIDPEVACSCDVRGRPHIIVRHTLQRPTKDGDVGSRLTPPKSRNSRRTLVLPEVLVNDLLEHRLRQDEERGSRPDIGFVFTTPKGTPLDTSNVWRSLRTVLARAGLPKLRFHDLRHACASLLAAQGIHPRVAMAILGHSDIRLTMNIYSHVTPELLGEAADAIGGLFSRP